MNSTNQPVANVMEKLLSLCKQRGFIYPGSEIYGGLANAWDYGPLGAQLKINIKRLWWKNVVESRPDMFGFDGAIMMNPRVWEASGHVATFNDPMIECKQCHNRFRADQKRFQFKRSVATTPNEIAGIEIQESMMSQLICPECGSVGTLTLPRQFNLMFRTTIGPVESTGTTVYLRPETAQALFVNFKNIMQTMRPRLPFGLAQIGKAFRNEITPGNYIFRTLEFEQMEIEYFIEPDQWREHFESWRAWMLDWAKQLGIDLQRLHELEVPDQERAHYSQRTIDFEFDFPFGRKELWGLAYRTDFDLKNHSQHSGEELIYTDPQDPKRKFTPHVIEPSLGVERTLLAVLLSAYNEETVNNETRIVLRLAPHLAPYQVAVLPLSKKAELTAKTLPLFHSLGQHFRCDYDETQSIGKRYRRQDEIGTPFCITFDFDSLKDEQVTIRSRDTMQQERIAIPHIISYLQDHGLTL